MRQWVASPFAPAVVAIVALALSALRWRLQASNNVYTALSKRFYVPDSDLGWRISTEHPIWLGLDACALLFAACSGVVLLSIWIRRRERRSQIRAPRLRATSWAIAAVAALLPLATFASGSGPLDGRDTLPASAAVMVEEGIQGAVDAPDGVYDVVRHEGTSLTVTLSAGGETFDARFENVLGTWRGSPRNLEKPMLGDISVMAGSIDTGVHERTKHAREKYLRAEQFPEISLRIERVAAVRATGRNQVVFRAPATVVLMGRSHLVQVTGTLQKLDSPALARLGLSGDVLLVRANFKLPILETALASKAHDFATAAYLPVHASLVMSRHL